MAGLRDLFFEHHSKVVDKWEQYLGIYEAEFSAILAKTEPIRMLEVGVQNGGSLELWEKYLPAGSQIVGVDIDPKCGDLRFDSPRISVHVIDAADPYAMVRTFKGQSFDIIIDDGSHISSDIISTFKLMFPFLKDSGKYIIEDLECSYYKTHEGGLHDPRSSIEWLKLLVDSVNADHIEADEDVPPAIDDVIDRYRYSVGRVTFYDSVAVIEKLPAAKERPFRRMLSGQARDVVPSFELLALQPGSVYQPMFFGSAAAQQLDRSLIEAYEAARLHLAQVDISIAEMRHKAQQDLAEAKKITASLYELLAVKDAHIATLDTDNALKEQVLHELRSSQDDDDAPQDDPVEKTSFRLASVLGLVKLVETQGRLIAKSWRRAERFERLTHRVHAILARRLHPRSLVPVRYSLRWLQKQKNKKSSALIRASGLFDADYYWEQNPDIESLVEDPVRHYVDFGAAEGRDPTGGFSTSRYRSAYRDVDDVGINPFLHYILYGAKEGRDAKPDVEESEVPVDSSPEAEVIRASGLFDADWYSGNYKDVEDADTDPFSHFMQHGLWEDRKPNAMFDPLWYRTFYPDINKAEANPFLHYLQWGALEGRSPCVGFDGRWYLESNPDVVESGENPLKHYMRLGKLEGRVPVDPHAAYRQYVLRDRQMTIAEADEIRRHIAIMRVLPRFVIFIEGTDDALRIRSRDALKRQFYPTFDVLDAELVSDLREPAEASDDCYLVWLSEGDILHERALYEFASELNADATGRLLYADDDIMAEGKRSLPFFKPDWSPDTLESLDYIGAAACFGMQEAWQDLRDASSHYDFVLRYTERYADVRHIRKVLCHRYRDAAGKVDADAIRSAEEALNGRLLRTGRRASLTPVIPAHACFDLAVDLRDRPLVSVVIPTAGQVVNIKGKSVDLLFHCIDTIVSLSTYKTLEFIVVDNGDLGQERAEALDRRGYTRLTCNDREFNIARKLNLGAAAASGELLLLLNDDVEPLAPDWIERLVEHFEKPHVGVVGSKLLYPDLTTQHVGVVLNAGVPDHVRRFRPRDDQGYFFSTAAVRNFVAVTGACMMTRTSTYRQVGGYTEALAVNYNDTDYCLKVIETGKTVVYAPRSELIHFESQSRVARVNVKENEYFAERWAAYGVSDPYYNERNLTVASPTFEVANNPRLL